MRTQHTPSTIPPKPYCIEKAVLALVPGISGFHVNNREETRALRDRVLAQSKGIRAMEENCLLNGRQQDLVMAEAVFAFAKQYHQDELDAQTRTAVEEMAAQLGINLAHLRE